MLAEGHGARVRGHLRHPSLNLSQVFRVIRVQLRVTLQLGAIDTKRQGLYVAQVKKLHHLSLARHSHPLRQVHLVHGIGHPHPSVLPLLGYHAGLRQVAIQRRQRVQLLQAAGRPQRQVTERPAVALFLIIVFQPLPFLQLIAYHAQQVVAKHLTILAHHHKGLVFACPLCCQRIRVGLCLLPIATGHGFRIVA